MILLENASILLPDGECVEGFVRINGAYIERVGAGAAPALGEGDAGVEHIDLKGHLLLPGFANAHTHSAMTLFAGAADGLKLQEWLFEKIFPLEAKLTPDDVYWATKLAGLEYLAGGTSAVFDMYFHQDATAQALQEMGLRTVLCGSLNDFGGSVEDFDTFFAKYGDSADSLCSFRAGIHAQYTTSLETIQAVGEYVNAHQKPFYTHCSETQLEVEKCVAEFGKTPVQLFADAGLFAHGGGIFHGVHLSETDRAILAELNVGVVSCPSSNLKLASGICEVEILRGAGVTVGLGTDGPASNNALDMLREMYLASVLQKNLLQDTTALPAGDTVHLATTGSAKIMGINAGVLAPGYLADLTAIRLNTPNMLLNSPLNNLVFSGSKADVAMTMVGGKVLYKDGAYLIADSVEEIYLQVLQIQKRIMV